MKSQGFISRMIDSRYILVTESPWRRYLVRAGVMLVVCAAVAFGYWLGRETALLDGSYTSSLEALDQAHRAKITQLNGELVDARLAQTVNEQASQSLRSRISELRDAVAVLEEEVVFYKSLMAPSSLAKGLQISDFELQPAEEDNQYAFRVLLTQAVVRRDWVQGAVELSVQGWVQADDGEKEESLSLADLGEQDVYPLRFKFRYFQNVTGLISLPDGFRPELVVVAATPRGRSADALQRSFRWALNAG